jgi:hypothetical protein
MNCRAAIAGLLVCLLASAAAAAPRSGDPTWPCQQPLVAALSAGAMWSGPSLDGIGDWHEAPAAAALVARIAPRAVPAADGTAAIADFTAHIEGDRTRLIALAFAGLLDESNRQRGEVIERIKSLAERQRSLADLIARLGAELDAMPATAEGAASAPRTELNERLTFTTRAYTELQRTMRYACDVPVQIDARLGVYARALQAGLS